MARIPPVTRDRVREDLRSIFDEVSSGPGGVGTGPMSVLKYSPEMARRAIPLFQYVRNDSILPQKVRELAMLTTARATDCPYIWNAHAALGRQAGLSDTLVNALRDRTPLPSMSGKKPWSSSWAWSFSRHTGSVRTPLMSPWRSSGRKGWWN